MTVLQQISNPYFASLILGLFYGLTFCTSACLPYLVGYIAGIEAGFKRGVIITSIYNLGRIFAYAIIGTAVGLISTVISEEIFSAYQQYSSLAFGIVIILIGINILIKKIGNCNCIEETQTEKWEFSKFWNRFDLHSFVMGFTRGLILCPPLVALILYSVSFSQVNFTILAVLFGVGTALSPLMFLGGAVGWLLKKAPLFSKWLSRIGGIALIFMGLAVLISSILEIS